MLNIGQIVVDIKTPDKVDNDFPDPILFQVNGSCSEFANLNKLDVSGSYGSMSVTQDYILHAIKTMLQGEVNTSEMLEWEF